MISQPDDFERFLRVLDGQGCLSDVMVVGSWAEYLYKHSGLLPDYDPNLKTMDIDFLVRNLRRPQPPINVLAAARAAGYVPDADYLDGVTKIYSDSGLEIEFLIGKKGAGREPSLKTNIGVTAQALWHLDMLLSHPVTARWRGMDVIVPAPEAYVAHKMTINGERGIKADKDTAAVVGLWPYIDAGKLHGVIFGLTKKERTKVDTFMREHNLELDES